MGGHSAICCTLDFFQAVISLRSQMTREANKSEEGEMGNVWVVGIRAPRRGERDLGTNGINPRLQPRRPNKSCHCNSHQILEPIRGSSAPISDATVNTSKTSAHC